MKDLTEFSHKNKLGPIGLGPHEELVIGMLCCHSNEGKKPPVFCTLVLFFLHQRLGRRLPHPCTTTANICVHSEMTRTTSTGLLPLPIMLYTILPDESVIIVTTRGVSCTSLRPTTTSSHDSSLLSCRKVMSKVRRLRRRQNLFPSDFPPIGGWALISWRQMLHRLKDGRPLVLSSPARGEFVV